MAKASIGDRLAKLKDKRRFLDWFAAGRFYQTLTWEELETCARAEVNGWNKRDRKSLFKWGLRRGRHETDEGEIAGVPPHEGRWDSRTSNRPAIGHTSAHLFPGLLEQP